LAATAAPTAGADGADLLVADVDDNDAEVAAVIAAADADSGRA
jgi:hypothetical protein